MVSKTESKNSFLYSLIWSLIWVLKIPNSQKSPNPFSFVMRYQDLKDEETVSDTDRQDLWDRLLAEGQTYKMFSINRSDSYPGYTCHI